VASFDKAIPPGGEGKITLSVRTKGYQGEHHWSAKVNTNDPIRDLFYLELKAFINVPILVSPRYVYLHAAEGQQVTRGIEVKAGLEKPLTLEPDQFNLKERVNYKILEVEKGKEFAIYFNNIPGPPGTYVGFLKLKTNYPEDPFITIKIRVRSVKAKNVSGQ